MDKRHLQMVVGFLLVSSVSACAGGGDRLSASRNVAGAPIPATVAFATRTTFAAKDAATNTVAIDAGAADGVASGGWTADTGYSVAGYSGVQDVTKAINTSAVTNPAPQVVYQTQRFATHVTYAIPNLTPAASYTVRLHFVESYFNAAGKRVFGARINGSQVLTNFDIFKSAGGANIAIVQQFAVAADANGKITIALDATVNNASIAGMQIIGPIAAPTPSPQPSPAPMPGPAVYADANVAPAGWQFPYSGSPFTIPACASDPCSPALDPRSSSEVTGIVAGGRLDLGDIYEGYPTDNDFPVYYASASDPAYTVTCDAGGCGTGTIVVNIPDGAFASAGSDHHLTVVNVSSGTETDFWEFNDNGTGTGTSKPVFGGGKLSSGSGGVCQKASFVSSTNACANSATGSGLPIQPQILDPREILAGSINHTLYVAIGCGQSGFAFPADHSDGYCPAGPKYGQRIWLDLSDAQIDALGDPPWATTMLHAMHHYGWTVSDNNGAASGVAFANLAPQSFTTWGQANPWTAFFRAAGGGNYATLPTTGIAQSNIHILAPCVNTQGC